MGEYQQAWDNLKLAASAQENFEVTLTDEQLLSHPDLGEHFRKLNDLYRGNKKGHGWRGPTEGDAEEFMALLVVSEQATDIFTDRFDQLLPSWWKLCIDHVAKRIEEKMPNVPDFRNELYWDVSTKTPIPK